MPTSLSWLFDTSGFPARWHCGDWSAQLGYLHIVSDLLTFLAYTAIPIVLAYYVIKRREAIAFPRVVWLFVVFIFACGTTHLLEAVIFYEPVYRLAGVVKAITAAASLATVVALFRVAPRALALPGLEKLNRQLTEEVEVRSRYERDLEFIEHRYRALVEMLSNVVWMTNAEGHVISRQASWERYTGQEWSAHIGVGWLDAFHEDDRVRLRNRWQEAIEGQEPFHTEGRLYHAPSQTYRHFHARAMPIRDDYGRIHEWVGTIIDDHESWLAESRFRTALEAAPSAMMMSDHDGGVVLVNHQAEELFGYSRDEFTRLSIEKLVPERFRHIHGSLRAGFVAAPETRQMGRGRELFALHRDGSEIPVEIGLTPIVTPEGPMVVCSIVDVTDRQRDRRELADRAQELARSNRDLDHFAAIVSHDLRAPLRAISNFSTILQRRLAGQLTPEQSGLFDRITGGAQRMDRLIVDLLAFSRVKSRTMGLEEVSLPELVDQLRDMVANDLRDLHGELIANDLPVVWADATLLRQVLQNLVVNAIRYRAERPPRIEITCRRDDGFWLIAVADNGVGIAEKHRQTIFQIFHRLNPEQAGPDGGTGIGLAICQRVIDLHGGEIWVESTVGEGSTFYFTLPVTSTARRGGRPPQETAGASSEAGAS